MTGVVAPPPPWATRSGREPFAEVTVGPNRVALLKDGLQAYPAMLDAIARAQRTVVLETYILRDDSMGMRFLSALMERASAGVEVLLMYDFWGSTVDESVLARLGTAGVKVHAFHPLKATGGLSRLVVFFRRRNHRKALVVDGEVGFTGGLNISDDYAAVVDGGQGWRDTHVRIVGPTALELEQLFLETWRRYKGARFDASRFVHPRVAGTARLRILGNDFSTQSKAIRKAYVQAIEQAASRIFLTHAYFLPPSRMLRALVRAAKRGVQVAVILAASTDVKIVLYAARGLYPKLLRAGVHVYEWQGRVLHAKTAVVDGEWATVGSSNLDPLSLRQNLEVNAVFVDKGMGAAVERLFAEDIHHAEKITQETVRGYGLLHRMLQWLAFRVRHWL